MAQVFTLAELAASPRPPTEVGGKAANLARLVSAGLPVPAGVVLVPGTERDPATLAALIAPHLASLGDRLAVRSSATIEDDASGSAAGLFRSRTGVTAAELARAIGEVLTSATSPAVAAYLDRRGARAGDVAIAVVVQRMVVGSSAGVVYTRSPDPADDGAALVEIGRGDLVGHATIGADGGVLESSPELPIDGAGLATLVALARRAGEAIGARDADVEWAVDADGPWLVQARPIAAGTTTSAGPPAELVAWSRATPDVTWTWDVDHNPDPLSPAQIGLVERVAPVAPRPMRVVAGYLYYGDRAAVAADGAAPGGEHLAALFHREVVPAIDRALAPVELGAPPRLVDALLAYEHVFAIYAGRLGPALAAARAALGSPGDTADGDAVGASELGRALERWAAGELDRAAVIELAAPMAAAWDVAAATYGEAPALLDAALARARRRDGGDQAGAPARRPAPDGAARTLAQVVGAIGEADDRLFFRAQAVVRRALLSLAARLGLRGDDVFYLPLAELLELERRGGGDPAALARTAAAARAVRDRQRSIAVPLAIRAGHALSPRLRRGGDLWRGRGFGAAVRGRVARADDLGRLELRDGPAVVVARALTPPMVALVVGAVAVVSERGGLLGHAAAIARELGVTCVVGCDGVHGAVADGDHLLVDGAGGLVVRLAPVATADARRRATD